MRRRLSSWAAWALTLACSRPTPLPGHTQAAEPGALEARPAATPTARAATGVTRADAGATARAPAPAEPTPAQQDVPTATTELQVADFLPSLVSWPDTRRWPQPLVLAAHGAGDFAESHCELWRHLLGQRGIVLCLRGRAIRKGSEDHGYYFADHLSLERETLAALEALTRRHPELVDARQAVYAGYSQGAQMGMLMLLGRGNLMPRLLLVEGGAGDWNPARARRFAKSGGERVALVCGTPGCFQNAERSRAQLETAGVSSVVHYARGAGHTYGGPVIAESVLAFKELTRGDDRWSD